MFSRTGRVLNSEVALVSSVKTLGEEIAQNAGIIDISESREIQMWPMPKSTTVRIVNPNNDKSADVAVYFFNEDELKNTKADNVYGAGAVDADKPVVTYNDGFNGKLINRLIKGLNGGMGMLCTGITVIGKDAAGNQSDEAILALDAAFQTYNGLRGTPMPDNFDLGDAIRSGSYKNGMVEVKLRAWINLVTQVASFCPKGYSYDWKFKWATN